MSIEYLTALPPPKDTPCVLNGFKARGGAGWMTDAWDPCETMKLWEEANA